MDIEANAISPPKLPPKEDGGGLLVHCGFLKWSPLVKTDDMGLLKSGLEYASNVPLELTNPVVFAGMYGIECRLSSLLSNTIDCRENEPRGETLMLLSETNEGVSAD